MKKLFTLLAFMACFLGAKAEWVDDYKIEYSSYTGFPFFVMGYVPEWYDGIMTDFGANYKYVTLDNEDGETSDVIVKTNGGTEYYRIELAEPGWHQYFIADGIPTEMDGSYTIKAMVKATEACNINVNMGWGWGNGEQVGATVSIPASEDFVEVEWEYSGIAGTSCNLVAQPGTFTGTIEWKGLVVSHNQKAQRPVQWQEWLTSDGQPVVIETTSKDIPTWMGNAETPWADPNIKWNDEANNYLICAWGKERMVNLNDDGGWDPFPATIEEEDGNHYYIVHGKEAITEGDPAAWDNQFWIESPKAWKSGTQVKISFRYKASKNVTVATQTHNQNPSNYLIWHAIGDVAFTTEWQTFEKTFSWESDMEGGWSVAFQLNQNDKDAIDFYFDDLSWQSMVLDEGYFVAGANPDEGIEYDFDNAVQFEYDENEEAWIATIGEKGEYISQVMISTIRGNDAAFKGATLKPKDAVTLEDGNESNWVDYEAGSLAKINLPGAGIWKILLDDELNMMQFIMIEGDIKEPIEINPNPTHIIINAVERDEIDNGDTEEIEGSGQPWDNQFFIVANRVVEAGESTVISFKYKSSVDNAKTSTQCHAMPGGYIHWGAIGDVTFNTGDWVEFEKEFTIPNECAGKDMKTIAFNMAEIKEACVYEITDVVWKLADNTESLIDQEGGKNFYIKIGAGTNPEPMEDTGVKSMTVNTKAATVTYNLAGQRVTNGYKGIVVKNNKKVVVK